MILNSPALALSSLTSRFLFQLDDLKFPGTCSLLTDLQVPLTFAHLLLSVVVLPVGVLGHLLGLLQLLGQTDQLLLVLRGSVLQDLLHAITVVSRGGGLVQLLTGLHELGLCRLPVLLQLLHPTVETVELGLSGQNLGLLLLLLHLGHRQLLCEDVKLSLKCLGFVLQLINFFLGFFPPQFGISAALLTGVTAVHQVVLLHLHGLHFLLDGLHGGPGSWLLCLRLSKVTAIT